MKKVSVYNVAAVLAISMVIALGSAKTENQGSSNNQGWRCSCICTRGMLEYDPSRP